MESGLRKYRVEIFTISCGTGTGIGSIFRPVNPLYCTI